MDATRCGSCLRSDGCRLRSLACRTLPWVVAARDVGTSEWERRHLILRALRGSGGSPGYVEDWLLAGALARGEVDSLVERVISSREVTLAELCGPCRHYLGPDPSPLACRELSA